MTPQATPAGLADITSEKEADLLGQNFEKVLHSALALPGVRIDRGAYLHTELRKHGTAEEVIARAIAASPVKAGIDPKTMDAIAASAIKVEVGRTTALSTLAGLPGGLAMIGTIPADLTQYFGHVMRLEQKLAYAYGWPAFVSEEGNIDDEHSPVSSSCSASLWASAARPRLSPSSPSNRRESAWKRPSKRWPSPRRGGTAR